MQPDTIDNLIRLESCASTNLEARELAKNGAPHGACVTAESQTAGRGRLGRSFYSPRGNGLYISFVLRPREAVGEEQLITCFAANAVTRAIEPFARDSYGCTPSIKWVNDVLIKRRKVAGILTEHVKSPAEAIILGIGVNLFGEADFPAEIADSAAVLFPERTLAADGSGAEIVSPEERKAELREAVLRAVIREVRSWDGGPFPPDVIEEYRSKSYLLGRSIHFSLDGEELFGVVTSVLDNGNLMVVLPEGKHVSLSSGEVTLHKRF